MEIEKEDLQAVFDIAVNSMDFGSGFLSHEEVAILRKVAIMLDVDPKLATPENFRSSFSHPYIPVEYYRWPDLAWQRGFKEEEKIWEIVCQTCLKFEDHESHK